VVVVVVPIERERSALARTLAPQRVVETPESVAGKGAWRDVACVSMAIDYVC
jgi:hypothetical protein